MSLLPEPLEKLILALERLPGIGPKLTPGFFTACTGKFQVSWLKRWR
jgi:hypothetical protein